MSRAPAVVFAFLVTAAALLVAGCGGGTSVGATPDTVVGTLPTPTTSTSDGAALTGDATAGKAIFASKGCAGCHTLAAAGATGNVGPNLDQAKPSAQLVVARVTNGQGAMPPFSGQLDPQQIADVAAYVVQSTGG